MAQAAGISRQHLWKLETGLVTAPSPEMLERLAGAYGLSLAQLFGANPASGRKLTLDRLMNLAEAIPDEDWRTIDEISKRISPAPPRKDRNPQRPGPALPATELDR